MGRKFNLKKECRDYLQRYPQGSKITQQERSRLVLAIIEDLATLHELPPRLSSLSATHIEKLVAYWTSEAASPATIGNRLGALRTLNRLVSLRIDIPSNQSLGITKASPAPSKINLPENYENKIFHPITHSIIALQRHLGLTKLEAIRLGSIHSGNDNMLLIERTIAHNKKDRTIPITTKMQVDALNERNNLIQTSPLLKQQDASSLINHLYIAECSNAGINPKTPFRQCYAQTRLKMLEETHDKQRALLILCKEMGFSAPRKLLGLLS